MPTNVSHRPHPRGGFRTTQAMSIAVIVAVLLPLTIPFGAESSGVSGASVVDATNAARASAALPLVEPDILLTHAAQNRADELVGDGRFDHRRSDGSSFVGAVVAMRYPYHRVAENLAKNYLHSDDVVRGWLGSPAHREQLLRSEYRHIGIGIATGVVDGVPTTIIVELLGQPPTERAPSPSHILSAIPTG